MKVAGDVRNPAVGTSHFRMWALFGLSLLATNFAFDWWRRMDFEAERRRIEGALAAFHEQTTTDVIGARAVSANLEARFTEVEPLLAGIQQTIGSLERVAQAAQGAPRDAQDDPREEAQDQQALAASSASRNLLETPVATMEAGLESVRGDPYLEKRYGDLLDMRTWEPVKLLADLENEFGVQLSAEQKDLVGVEVECYRQVGHLAYSRFQIEKCNRLGERIMARDYDHPDEQGVFRDLNLPPGEVFASATIGYRRFAWERSKEPEMYRWNCLFKYVPVAMLERLRTIFRNGGL